MFKKLDFKNCKRIDQSLLKFCTISKVNFENNLKINSKINYQFHNSSIKKSYQRLNSQFDKLSHQNWPILVLFRFKN